MKITSNALLLTASSAVLAFLTACSGSPSATTVKPESEVGVRTGSVRNIAVSDTITPDSLTVRAGDEVRWINQRKRPVTVKFQEPLEHAISCQRGFMKNMGVENAALIAPNESAGLCFTQVGSKHYTVTADEDDRGRPTPGTGTITVE
jgi:plastocyanin